MEIQAATLLSLTFILLFALVVPEFFKRLRLPFVTSLIVIGAILGPNSLNYLQTNEVLDFFGFMGFTFLMFMAGLETKLKLLGKKLKEISVLALVNSMVPFLVGMGIGYLFGYDFTSTLILATIFVSSSVAVIVPTLKSANLLGKKDGQIMLTAVVLQDIASLVLLAVIFQSVSPVTSFSLPFYFMLLVVSVIALNYFLPKLSKYALKKNFLKGAEHEEQLRFVIVMLILVLSYFSLIGVHPLLGSFLVGLLLAGEIKSSKTILSKIHTIGYGLFVPVFFVIVGMDLDFGIFRQLTYDDLIVPAVLLGLITSKFLSGYFASRAVKLNSEESIIFGLASTTQLTTTLSATFAASQLNLLNSELETAVIILAIVTTFSVPVILRFYPKRLTVAKIKEHTDPVIVD